MDGVRDCSHFGRAARTTPMHTGRQRADVVNKEQDITIAEQVRKGHDEHFALVDLSLLSTKGMGSVENV